MREVSMAEIIGKFLDMQSEAHRVLCKDYTAEVISNLVIAYTKSRLAAVSPVLSTNSSRLSTIRMDNR